MMLLILTVLVSYPALNKPEMKNALFLYPYAINNRKEYFRFLTHGFVHADMTHLLINMFVLWQFGEVLENGILYSDGTVYKPGFAQYFGPMVGKFLFLGMYVSAIICSSVVDYQIHKNNKGYAALGASGATSAVVMGYVLLDPWAWFLFPPVPALVFAIGYLWYSNKMAREANDNIGHNAHFYGTVYGFLFIITASLILNSALITDFMAQLLEGPSKPPFF